MEKLFDFLENLCIAVLFLTITVLFVFRMIVVDGSSMLPTLEENEKLIVSNFMYTPEKGDIVITDSNNGFDKPLVKRIIATGGDTIRIDYTTGDVYVNGSLLQEDYILEKIRPIPADDIDMTVPAGYVFLMGDNRNSSSDSRVEEIGVINEKDLLGKAVLRISPLSKIGKVK